VHGYAVRGARGAGAGGWLLIVACSLVSSLGEVTIWRLSGGEGSGVYVCGKVYMGILLFVEFVFCIR
jgi:hypothetical protein